MVFINTLLFIKPYKLKLLRYMIKRAMDGGTEQKHLIFSEGQGPGFSDIFLHGYDTKITPIISHKSIAGLTVQRRQKLNQSQLVWVFIFQNISKQLEFQLHIKYIKRFPRINFILRGL